MSWPIEAAYKGGEATRRKYGRTLIDRNRRPRERRARFRNERDQQPPSRITVLAEFRDGRYV